MLLQDIEGGPVPPWLDLDTTTGILTINTNVDDYWFGRVRATNASGSDEVFIDVCAGIFCGEVGRPNKDISRYIVSKPAGGINFNPAGFF